MLTDAIQDRAPLLAPVRQDAPRATWGQRLLHYGWGTILIGAIAMAATYPGARMASAW